MLRMLALCVACGLLSVAGAASAHKLIVANEAVEVAKSDLSVTPAVNWNRISTRPGESAERWTMDGELLNDVLFFAAIRDGDTLLKEVDKRESPLPKFSSEMLLIDLPQLVESSFRIVKGYSTFQIGKVEPAKFLGQDGVRFEFSTLGSDDIVRRGRAVAVIIKGQLYMMMFEAPEVYFFGRYEAQFEQLVSSARLK